MSNEIKPGAWVCIDSGGEPFSAQINAAVDAALAADQKEGKA
jgi:hypothetical protein